MENTVAVSRNMTAIQPYSSAGVSTGVSNDGSAFSGYLAEVRKYPLLSEAEELSLLIKVHKFNDRDAATKLVLSNLRFVIHIARTYQGYGLNLADLIQEGNIGLIKAIKKFDTKHGVRLITFAVHWIRAEIHEFIIKNWKIVKIATTKAQRKLFYRIRSMKKSKQWFTKKEVTSIAKELDVKPGDVTLMEQRMSHHDIALDETINDSDESTATSTPMAYLSAPESEQPHEKLTDDNELSTQREMLSMALLSLDERSREIITARYLKDKKLTLDTISKSMSISIERVRQLEERALKNLREKISAL